MTDFSKNKVQIGNGDGQGYGPDILFFDKNEEGCFMQNSVPVSTIKRVAAYDSQMTVLSLYDGAEIRVAMPFDELYAKLHAAGPWLPVIDLLAVTGNAAEAYLANASLSQVFNKAVSGTRRKGEDFEIVFYGAYAARDAHSGDVEEYRISSSELSYFEADDDYDNVTYIDTQDSAFYVPLPLPVLQQFYTHAKRGNADTLDLRHVTDPEGRFQKDDSLIARIPKLYNRVSSP